MTKHLDTSHIRVYGGRVKREIRMQQIENPVAILLRARFVYAKNKFETHLRVYTRGTNLHESALFRISPRFITLLERSLITVGRRRRGGALKTARRAVSERWAEGGREETPLLYKERVLRITTSSHFEKENAGNNRAKCVEWTRREFRMGETGRARGEGRKVESV